MQLLVIQFTIKIFRTGFMQVLVLYSLKSQYYKIFKTLKLSYLQIKWSKIILLLQFSWSQSVWWPYIQSVCWCYCRARPLRTCRSVIICEIIVHLLVIVQNSKRCTVQGIKIKFVEMLPFFNLLITQSPNFIWSWGLRYGFWRLLKLIHKITPFLKTPLPSGNSDLSS